MVAYLYITDSEPCIVEKEKILPT